MTTQPSSSKLAALEAILFVSGEAVSLTTLEKLLQVEREALKVLLEEYKALLMNREGSLVLVQDTQKVRLAVGADFHELVEALAKQELQEALSKAALEVLALVSYLAPVSRSQIDSIRGVNSQFTLRNLSLRGLINRSGNPEGTRGYIYEPSMQFLETLGLTHIKELPNYEALRGDERLLKLLQKQEEESVQTA